MKNLRFLLVFSYFLSFTDIAKMQFICRLERQQLVNFPF